MADRKLKVYHSFRSSDKKAVPEVRLIGQWLEQSGRLREIWFAPGDYHDQRKIKR